VEEIDGRTAPIRGLREHGGGWSCQADLFEQCGGVRASDEQAAALGGDVGRLNLVHDDEAVEMGEEPGDLIAAGLEQEGVFEQKRGEVAQDVALGVEREVVAALAGGELRDGVGEHSIEPAQAVGAGDAQPADVVERSETGGAQQGGKLRGVGERRGLEGLAGLNGGGHFGVCANLRTLLIIATVYAVARRSGVGLLRQEDGLAEGCGGLRLRGRLTLVAVVLCISAACAAQTPAAVQTNTPPTSAAQGAATTVQGDATPAPLTKEQAKELFRSVDEILSFASADTGLPIVHSVKRKLITRDEVNKYLREKFDEDQGAKRLAREEIVLKKFGLLDRDFNLRPFMISLLTEQVAGFYDDKTKTVNLLDWIQPEEQKPVLAHELTHALQDQRVGLTKWAVVGSDAIAKNAQEDNEHIQTDEADTARDAVTEGQAMVVFLDYSLRPTGKTLEHSPELMEQLKDKLSDTGGSPILARAPLLLQQSLLFPYDEGMSFEDAILVKGGKEAAFGAVLANPPASTFEILHPAAYMAHTPVPVLRLPDIHPLIDAQYMPYDVGVMGEFDVQILTELFGGDAIASALAPEWRGGIYYAAQKRSAVTTEAKESTASIGLLYESKWRNDDSARSFLRVYADELPRKYSTLVRRTKDEADDNEQVYSTNEGDVLLTIDGTGVFVSEGFPLELARKLRESITSVQSDAPLELAGVKAQKQPGHTETALPDPGLSLVQMMSSAGVMKAAMGRGE